MKNESKKNWFIPLFLMIGLSFWSAVVSGLPLQEKPPVSCSTPEASLVGKSSGTFTFSWGTVTGAFAYKVYYVRRGDGYTSPVTTTSGNSISFSQLPSGIYDFYFAAVCDEGVSPYIVLEDLMM
jgi:hypothetical protein